MSDWIDMFMEFTAGAPSPPKFRLWAAITAIAGALERRVYTRTYAGNTYPNMYTALAGKSGSGKSQSIGFVRDLWASIPNLHLAPDNVSNAAFYDALGEATRTYANGSGMVIFNALAVCNREFGVFVPKYETGFLSDLSDLWDNPPQFDSRRRVSRSVKIDRPTVNILLGVTPSYLGALLPETAWGQGFCSRIIFIYDHLENRDPDLFRPQNELNMAMLKPRLHEIFELTGEVTWSDEAQKALRDWLRGGMQPEPMHSRLREYCARRIVHLLKLSMISAVSAGRDLYVAAEDFERAQDWLLKAEEAMPDVFRAMTAKSDQQIIEDLGYHIYSLYMRVGAGQKKPVHDSEVYDFMKDRVESFKVDGILNMAIRSGHIRKGVMPDEWLPGPKNLRPDTAL